MCDASGLDVFDEDPLAAASCRVQTHHAEAQTPRQRPGQTDQLCVTALHQQAHADADARSQVMGLALVCTRV